MNQDNNNVINFQNQFNNEPVYATFGNRVISSIKGLATYVVGCVCMVYSVFYNKSCITSE